MNPLLVGLLGIMAGSVAVAICHCFLVLSNGTQTLRSTISTNQGEDDDLENGRENAQAAKNMDELTLQVIVTSEFSEECKEDMCVVCLGEFMEGQGVRVLPECSHAFHSSCIDRWVDSNPSCPICRADLIPSPYIHACPSQ
ncbi:RING-H2 finger protein ATL73-like [Henckelia pumila]|uniref:RING-H2 finger protein ATL73-like n=1 Tax=Henckelia pumila TaxID=405737 RepID=UPI003C6DF2B3